MEVMRVDKYIEFENKVNGRCETLYEDEFVTFLLDSGLYKDFQDIEPQKKVYVNGKYKYRLDFLLIKNDGTKIAVEIDGNQHKKLDHRKNDEIRDEYLMSNGIKVLRFFNYEVPFVYWE